MRLLKEQLKLESLESEAMEGGRFPWKLLWEMSSTVRFDRPPKLEGIGPEKLLSLRSRLTREAISVAIRSGRAPVRPLCERSRALREKKI